MDTIQVPEEEQTIRIVGISFPGTARVFRYDSQDLPLQKGDRVVVQGSRGGNLGTVASDPRSMLLSDMRNEVPRVIRKAGPRELARDELSQERARDAQRLCYHRIRERQLPMKLIKAESFFDGSKMIFYFFAEDRIDFRDLVRDLAQSLHTRIEMKQIGPRDETRIIGGIGPCGRELCCSSWLREFSAVSVKMAKEQGLSVNPSKLAGMCGRLKCCLRYEYQTYVELGRALPGLGSVVETVKGNGTVSRQNVLKQTVVVRREGDGAEIEVSLEDLVTKRPN